MSGIMAMFQNMLGNTGNTVTPPQPTQGATTPGNIPDTGSNTGVTNANTAPNGVVPPAPVTTTEVTPLDKFATLWDTAPTDGSQKPSGVFGEVDPSKFMEAAGKIDFSKSITPEQLTAISQGGEAAVQAFAAALNKVSQGVYAQSAFASTKLIEQALAKSKESFLAELPTHIKQQTVRNDMRAENPIFSNPAVQPIISALEQQLTVKYPQATSSEITTMAKEYVEALGTSFAPKPPENKSAKKEPDWSTWAQ